MCSDWLYVLREGLKKIAKGILQKKKNYKLGLLSQPPLTPHPPFLWNLGPINRGVHNWENSLLLYLMFQSICRNLKENLLRGWGTQTPSVPLPPLG